MSTLSIATYPASVQVHQGRWHVVTGNEIRRTFSGTDAARHAADMALFLNHPPLARLVAGFLKVCPTLWKTAHRAADLIVRQHLTAPISQKRASATALASVRSGTRSDTTYLLKESTAGDLTCTCPSFCEQPFYGPAGKPFCKHLLAYVLQRRLGQPLPPAPTPALLWEKVGTTLQAQLQPATWQKLFADAVLSPRSTLTRLRFTVPDKAIATLLTHPQWQTALTHIATNHAGYPVQLNVTARRARHSTPALTLVPAPVALPARQVA